MTDPPEDYQYATPLGRETVHHTEIGGYRWSLNLYPAGEGFDHLPYLLKVASGPSGVVVDFIRGAIAGSIDAAETTGREIREGLTHLAEQLVQHGGARKVKELLKHVTVETEAGEKSANAEFDTVFQGRYGLLLQVLAWTLEVNYAPFLRENWRGIWASARSLSEKFAAESSDKPSE